MSVDKDYVQIAMSNLNNEKASPELREWSVTILNKLSPVPMKNSLKKELRTVVYVSPSKIPLPEFAGQRCPNLIEQDKNSKNTFEHHNKMFDRFVREYEDCRLKFDGLVKYINDINSIR